MDLEQHGIGIHAILDQRCDVHPDDPAVFVDQDVRRQRDFQIVERFVMMEPVGVYRFKTNVAQNIERQIVLFEHLFRVFQVV